MSGTLNEAAAAVAPKGPGDADYDGVMRRLQEGRFLPWLFELVVEKKQRKADGSWDEGLVQQVSTVRKAMADFEAEMSADKTECQAELVD